MRAQRLSSRDVKIQLPRSGSRYPVFDLLLFVLSVPVLLASTYLFVATLLTLLFLPALYVAWFRIKEPQKEREVSPRYEMPAVAK